MPLFNNIGLFKRPNASFGTGLNGLVNRNGLVCSHDSIFVCGDFTTYKGVSCARLAKLNKYGRLILQFNINFGTGFNGEVRACAVQADGKILACGGFTTLNGVTVRRIARLNNDGTPDTVFNTNTGTGFTSSGLVLALAIQTDGKIIVAGHFTEYNGNTRNGILRLNADGTEDTAFYTNCGTGFNFVSGFAVTKAIIQNDGKIVCCGFFSEFNGNIRNRIVRLNADGTEDTAFYTANGGYVINLLNVIINQSNTLIYVFGLPNLYRINIDGSPDATFTPPAFNNNVQSCVIESDGKIVLVGNFTTPKNRIIRLNTNGTEDTTFSQAAGFPSVVAEIIKIDNYYVTAGQFTTYKEVTANRIIAITTEGNRLP